MTDQDSTSSNRRESFRLTDNVTLTIRILDEESLQSITDDFNAFRLRYCMKSHLQNQKSVRKPKLIRIKKANPDIAEYLESLEDQIAKLAERMDQAVESQSDAVEFSTRADISATGLRFRTNMALNAGEVVEIGMVLSTKNTQVVMLGDVLRTEERKDGRIAVSVHYSYIHPEDTEAIIRHLAKLQQLELQSRHGTGHL